MSRGEAITLLVGLALGYYAHAHMAKSGKAV